MITVLIIDNDKISVSGIKSYLVDPEVRIIGEAHDGASGLNLTAKLLPDIVIVDLFLPDITGLEVVNRIYKKRPTIKSVFITGKEYVPTFARLLKTKAKGILTKNSNFSYIEAIKAIARGETYVEPSLAFKLMKYVKEKHNVDELTDREYEVLLHFSQGKPFEKIAESFHVSTKTISNYKLIGLRKMGTDNPHDIQQLLCGDPNRI